MNKQRIVVKIGSSSLTNEQGEIDEIKMDDHVEAIAALRAEGHTVILVSSGAVAAGFAKLGYASRPVTLKGKQASAAVGQSFLIQSYINKFSKFDLTPAQLLLTRADFANRKRYRNAFSTLMELLDRGMLPIINENDTVVVNELTFGDNDMLSALVSGFIHADKLIILTDINGLYDANPHANPNAERFDSLEEITDDMMEAAGDSGSSVGTGGMKSKLLAAQTATSLGVPVFIGLGKGKDKLQRILNGDGDGTYINSNIDATLNTSKQWIALHSESSGKIFVDRGAEEAVLHKGKSLLPAGVFNVKGTFEEDDVVEVYGTRGLIGKGEVNYSSETLKQKIYARMEQKETDAFSPAVEVIHRDRWVEENIIGRDLYE